MAAGVDRASQQGRGPQHPLLATVAYMAIWRTVTATPWPMALVPRSVQYQVLASRRIPGDSPAGRPALAAVAEVDLGLVEPVGAEVLAAMIVPTLEDWATMSAKVMSSGA